MDITKTVGISGNYRDQTNPLEWNLVVFSKVVFLDKTNPSATARAYQLNDAVLSDTPPELLKSTLTSFDHEAFIFLGEVNAVDKKNKKILLTNSNTVMYTHLVTIAGTKGSYFSHNHEFANGVQALAEALRQQPKMPSPLFNGQPKPNKNAPKTQNKYSGKSGSVKTTDHQEGSSSQIEQIAHPHLASAGQKEASADLTKLNRLYEVQL